ncbi:MAG: class F sortase [Dehalococcoidia bacterium]|nr:class F sortase [Dehalococcoidia bacterium]
MACARPDRATPSADRETAPATSAPPTATPPPSPTPPRAIQPAPRRTPEVVPVVRPPVRLRIPSIGVDAAVREARLDSLNEMVIPTDGDYAAWYAYSPPPGVPGNAIIAGHVDWAGRAGVFARLRDLAANDLVVVVASDGVARAFAVAQQRTFPVENAPMEWIFGPTPRPTVTLITCGGTFIPARRDYSHRLVVRAEARSS